MFHTIGYTNILQATDKKNTKYLFTYLRTVELYCNFAQYRIAFTEDMEAGKQIATICYIIELSNHYK